MHQASQSVSTAPLQSSLTYIRSRVLIGSTYYHMAITVRSHVGKKKKQKKKARLEGNEKKYAGGRNILAQR